MGRRLLVCGIRKERRNYGKADTDEGDAEEMPRMQQRTTKGSKIVSH